MDIFFAALALMTVGLLKSYRNISEKELRHRAREGDELAKALFRAVSYGSSLGALLWILVVLANSIFFVFVSRNSPAWFAIAATAAILWYGFVWMPARDVTKFSTWAAIKLAPAFSWLLNLIDPILNKVVRFFDKYRPVTIHTGIYDKEDLIELLEDQKSQEGNRIDISAIQIAQHALSFGDLLVREIMVPRRAVKLLNNDETIGPILMDELHKSGFSRFPVYTEDKDNLIGSLHIKDLISAKAGGKVEKIKKDDLIYIHEDQSLADALQAILKTHRHQYVVLNSFEEFVGIITLEDVMEQIVGQPIRDEFDQYEDPRAVAECMAKIEHKEHENQISAADKASKKTSKAIASQEKSTEDSQKVVKSEK